MPLHAVEDVDDAYRATRAFLWPADRTVWTKLALVVLFVAGPGGGYSGAQTSVPADSGPSGAIQSPATIGGAEWLVVAVIVGLIVVVGLAVLLVGSVMEFVLIESLRNETVTLRAYWGRRWRQGLRLFGFRLLIGLVFVGSTAVVAALILIPSAAGIGPGAGGGVSVATAILLLPLIVVLGVVTGLIDGLTTVFAVPVMVHENRTVLGAWRRLWPTITANLWQYLGYVVVSVVLNVVVGVLAALAVGVGAVVLLIPFGLLAAIGVLVATAVEPLGIGVVALAALLFGVSLLAVAALVQVPFVVYLRYYALLVLGDIEESLDLIADRREAVRAADGAGGTEPNGVADDATPDEGRNRDDE